MRLLGVVTGLVLGLVLFTKSAQAIVILPAVILIPIAKLVALIIGGLSLPSTTVGVLWSKLFKTSIKRTLSIVLAILLILGVILFVALKLILPEHPLI